MEVKIVSEKEKTLVTIECPCVTPQIHKLKEYIQMYAGKIWASADTVKKQVSIQDILYFESVDSKTFLYTCKDVLEIPERLYELETILADYGFLRCSKSIIVNLNQIDTLTPELNRSILATMHGGDQITISRRYVKAFLNKLSI